MDGNNDIISVSDFCNLNKKVEKITLRSGAVMGREIHKPLNERPQMASRSRGGCDYARKIVEEEEKSMLRGVNLGSHSGLPGSSRDALCEMEDFTSMGSAPNFNDVESEDCLRFYDRYNFTPRDSRLPIKDKRKLIVNMIETNQVLIILGATGCGKTTQVPQFILDHHAKEGKRCNIVVTQPRRIAAISVANRVCKERGWQLPSVVGYQIGLDNNTTEDTILTYCTTGVLREKLVKERNMSAYTHVIIDEVHERDLETDFLMLIVRKLLRTNSRSVKVILMSATIDPSQFAEYFSIPLGDTLCPAPVIEVEKETTYKVTEYYITQLEKLGTIPKFDVMEPQVHEDVMNIAIRLIQCFDKIDLDTFVFRNQRQPTSSDVYKCSVLVFLPGLHEIETMHDRLDGKKKQEKYLWHLIPLHSTISKREQAKVFENPEKGYRKIILSTNIAESSITVPDVVYVIDFCLTKHIMCDPVTNFTSLRYAWASHSNCKQRAGRAGRVREGRVYRMVPEYFYQDKLGTEAEPEMTRCPLAQTALKAKLLKMGSPKDILALALNPPDLTHLETTILTLKEAGALLMTCEGKPSQYDGDITFLGTVMSSLPIDIHLSKMIMLGNVFSILDDAIVMAAWMTVRNVFKNDFYERLGPYATKISFAGGSSSDCIAYLHLYHLFTEKLRTNYFKTSNDDETGWCQRFFVNEKSMSEANQLVDELRKRLKNIGVYESAADGRVKWDHYQLQVIRKVVMAGAFYPNYFVRGAQGGQVNEEEAVKFLNGKDPFSTVYLQGMPSEEPGELYAKAFKDILQKHAGVVSNVSFDGSSKVYIEFEKEKSEEFPGRICYPVYRAVKMRQLRIPIEIPALSPEEARKRMEHHGLAVNRYLSLGIVKKKTVSHLPDLSVQDIEFMPSYVNNPNQFWIHPVGIESELNSYQDRLNTPGNTSPPRDKPKRGGIYAAPYPRSSEFLYRVQIRDIINPNTAKVFFIDYGNSDEMPIKLIYELGPNIQDLKYIYQAPPLALECTLKGIAPSALKNENESWSTVATETFKAELKNKKLLGEVYSVVDEVISLTVKPSGSSMTVNEVLIRRELAIAVEESYRSRNDNSARINARDYNSASLSTSCFEECDSKPQQLLLLDDHQNNRRIEKYLEPPSRQECRRSIRLRGPSSPLEMKVHGCTRVLEGKETIMDVDSVNSVLLDSNPQDPHERLLVAGHVATNSSGSKLKLGHTTLMPNVHGLVALMCLIFSPSVELRLSADKTRYIGALCGLGYDSESGESYFPENEMEITFDCLIDLSDLEKVNKLRFWISRPLATAEGDDLCDATPAQIHKAQKSIKEIFLDLFERPRPSQEIELPRCVYRWQQYDEEDLLCPDHTDPRGVYPPHFALATRI